MMTKLFIPSIVTAHLLQGVALPFGLGKGSASLCVHKLIPLPLSKKKKTNKTKAFLAGLDNLFTGEALQCHWRREKKATSLPAEMQLSEAGCSNWFTKHSSAEQVRAGSEFHN